MFEIVFIWISDWVIITWLLRFILLVFSAGDERCDFSFFEGTVCWWAFYLHSEMWVYIEQCLHCWCLCSRTVTSALLDIFLFWVLPSDAFLGFFLCLNVSLTFSFSLAFSFLKIFKNLFIWKVELTERERQGDNRERTEKGGVSFHPLAHSPNGHKGWGSQAKLRYRELHLSLPHGCRGPGTWPSSAAFPGALSGSWIDAEQPGLHLALIRDNGIAGSGLTSCTTATAPYSSNSQWILFHVQQ